MPDLQTADELRKHAHECLDRGDNDGARDAYRAASALTADRDDLGNLLVMDKRALLEHLRAIWARQRSWFVGFVLARESPTDEAVGLYAELLKMDLSPENRWRVQCKRIELTLVKGARQPGLANDFLEAWNYLDRLGSRGVPLMRGMAKSLARGDNDEAFAFYVELAQDARLPAALRPFVTAKVIELEELCRLMSEVQ